MYPILVVVALFMSACGTSSTTSSAPIITRINPTTATAGDTVTIFGWGFSAAAELNVVMISGTETLGDAGSWALVANPVGAEIESFTFIVPAGITAGTYPIYVYVAESNQVTNTDITITIN